MGHGPASEQSESNSPGELQRASGKLVGNSNQRLPKSRPCRCAIPIRPAITDEVCVIEDIERLSPEIQVYSFGKSEWAFQEW